MGPGAATVPDPEPTPDRLRQLFELDAAVHAYGLADLEPEFWSQSSWYLRDAAAVGVLELAGSQIAIVYAVSARAPDATLGLLTDLADAGRLPAHALVTGPLGTAPALDRRFEARWCTPHVRMHLTEQRPPELRPSELRPPDRQRRPHELGPSDLGAIEQLFDAAPDSGRFFTPSMLDTHAYIGHYEHDELVAMAGVHVLSERFGVAAIGNLLTHPEHRGEGHAETLMRALCTNLRTRVDVITLNVSDDNPGARRLYDRLGFDVVLAFDEGEFVAR